MNRDILIKETIDKIEKLPDLKIQEVNDFAEFLLRKTDDKILLKGIQKITSDSKSYDYLKNEEDFYSVKDLKNLTVEYVSENSLAKDWLRPEEDDTWKDL